MTCSECAGFDLEPVLPIAPPQTLEQVACNGQTARLPLPNDVEILVKQQLGIAPEGVGTVTQQNSIAPCGGARPEVQPGITGTFQHANMVDPLTKHLRQCRKHVRRRAGGTSSPGVDRTRDTGYAKGAHSLRRPNTYLLANTKAAEDPAQQVLGGEFAGDRRKALLCLAKLFGHELSGTLLDQLPLRFPQVRVRP